MVLFLLSKHARVVEFWHGKPRKLTLAPSNVRKLKEGNYTVTKDPADLLSHPQLYGL